MPVPRALSSNCSISAQIETDEDIKGLINEDIEKVFIIEAEENKLIYESE